MKFTLLTVLAAAVAVPVTAEVYLKEQFNDEVSLWGYAIDDHALGVGTRSGHPYRRSQRSLFPTNPYSRPHPYRL
jgi:hypothetical protein